MSQHIRDRINRKLDTLDEARLYQALDYVEFLEGRYGVRPPAPANTFQRFADGIEDRLRAGGMAVSTVSEAMGLLNRAVGVLNGVAAAGRSVAGDLATAAQRVGTVVSDAAAAAATPPPGGTGPATEGAGGAAGGSAPNASATPNASANATTVAVPALDAAGADAPGGIAPAAPLAGGAAPMPDIPPAPAPTPAPPGTVPTGGPIA